MSSNTPRIKETTNGGTRGYFMPAPLVNALIVAIFGSLIGIAGYMTQWAINDAQHQTIQEQKLSVIERQISLINTKISTGILPIAAERIDTMNRRVERLEEHSEEHDREDH